MTDGPVPHTTTATMTFEELVRGCTPNEREQLAWHLAQMRARKTYEALRTAPCQLDDDDRATRPGAYRIPSESAEL